MIKVFVVGHGDFPNGLIESMKMIAGENKNIYAISLDESESFESLNEHILACINENDNNTNLLFLVDLYGATPFNTCLQIKLKSKGSNSRIITGVNLPMLLEISLNISILDLDSLTELAFESGRKGIEYVD